MKHTTTPYFLHVDLDAFFASVEQLDNPEYRGKPLIVGGLPGEARSVVSTASYEARKYGVHSAMPIATAYKLCPNGIYVHGRMDRYLEMSAQIMSVFHDFSPEVEQMSIDEAFIDLTGTEMLFGKPSDTAKKIQEKVKEKTGLTVSVGIASNKYIAKIASALQKPNGFTEIPSGKEEDFILSLPLEKIWGIGDKTRKRINDAGIKTTKQIHEKSLGLLQTLFGNATGNFLYATVHGLENGAFTGEAKSHSVSAERTFSTDITDTYAAETILLELSQTVMFRLLREKLSGKTVVLKLRYDDFTTITPQNSSTNIISSDELFDRICKLFENHYEKGRGIRLLGVGVANIENESYAQHELFDDKPQKKQAIEKAIINLEEKHPQIKVSRARLLGKKIKSVVSLLMLSMLAIIYSNLQVTAAETTTTSGAGSIITDIFPNEEPDFSPGSLFNLSFGDNDMSLMATGFWQAGFAHTTTATFGYGTPFALSFGVPVFQQKVDLMLSFWLNNQFFFETSFADGFTKNTIALGYIGKSYLKEIRIANRGIVFPSGYTVDLLGKKIGGGQNQAPGISAHFEDVKNNKWKADAVIRYDMTKQRNATFYGKSSYTKHTIALSAFETGQEYALPATSAISDIANIYVETVNGSYTDSNGRKYAQLARDEYLLLPTRSQILISRNARAYKSNGKLPSIVVTFYNATSISELQTSLGSYGKNGTPSGYLGELQKFFFPNGEHNLANYSFAENVSEFFTSVNGETALILQSPSGFSPFADSSRYDLGIDNGAIEATIISERTETISQSYDMVIIDNSTSFYPIDFFNEAHIYADAIKRNENITNYSSPQAMFPFANTSPGIYLGFGAENDNIIRVNTSTPVTRYDIGTDVDAGSVRVYINDVIDINATYDTSSGTVTLSQSVNDTDKIYITWQEDTTTSDAGAVAGALGFSYEFFNSLVADTTFSVFWPVTPNRRFADSSSTSSGFITLALGAKFSNDKWENIDKTGNFSITNASGVSLESANTLSKYRILGMDDNSPSTYYLGQLDGRNVPSSITPNLNKRPNETGASIELQQTDNRTTGSTVGIEYTGITGYTIPLEWGAFDAANTWAARQVRLSAGGFLSQGTEFSIALRLPQTLGNDVDVYLQLGIDSSDDANGEMTDKIPTWKIYDGGNTIGSTPSNSQKDVMQALDSTTINSWQQIKVAITDVDRARLTSAHDVRIIVVKKTGVTTTENNGTILIGPYETSIKSIFATYDDSYTVTTPQFKAKNIPYSSDFNTTANSNYAQAIVWHNDNLSLLPPTKTTIAAARYFKEINFSAYETANLAFSYTVDGTSAIEPPASEDDDAIILTFDNGAESVNDTGRETLKAAISKSELIKYIKAEPNFSRIPELTSQSWHTLSVNLNNGNIYIDGNILSSKAIINTTVVPSRMKIQITTTPSGKAATYSNAMFCFDEIHLDGAAPSTLFQNVTKASYKKDGHILKAGDVAIIENFSASATATESASIKTRSGATDGNITANGAVKVTILSIALSADGALASNSKDVLTTAGHDISTTTPILNMLSLHENYRYNKTDNSLEKQNSASLSFNRFNVPLTFSFDTKATEKTNIFKQNLSADMKLAFNEKLWNTSLTIKTDVSQNIPTRTNGMSPDTSNYFKGWYESSRLAFSGGINHASTRLITNEAKLSVAIPVISLTPEISFAMNGNYTNSQESIFSDSTSMKFTIPFAVNRHSFSFDWQKTGRGSTHTNAGGTYLTDYTSLASAMQNRKWFFESFPIYDLISEDLAKQILSNTSSVSDGTSSSTDTLAYSSIYSASWKRPISTTITDFFVPSAITLSVSRDIHTAQSLSDLYQTRLNLQHTAFNLFGSESNLSLFKWYEQDELVSSFTFGFKIPRTSPSQTVFTTTGYIQTNLYLPQSGVLQAGIELNGETNRNWNGRLSLSWKRNSHINPLASLIGIIIKTYDKSNASITRINSLDFAFSSTPTAFSQSYTITHKAEAKLLSFFSVTYGIAAGVTVPTNAATTVSTTLSLGGKASF